MAKKSNNYSHDWLTSKGYSKQTDGSYSPPPVKSEFIKSLQKDRLNLSFESITVKQHIDDYTHLGIKSKPLVVFDITPIGAPRMTKSDTWKLDPFHKDPRKRQRKPVTQYFAFKNKIKELALIHNFTLPESSFHAVFVIPMAHSWSDKKKGMMDAVPHQQKPDVDNMIKALKDSLCENDATIWDYRITKYWGRSGKIIIYAI